MEPELKPMSWRSEFALAAAGGLLTVAMPIHRWPRRAQWTLHASTGLVTGAAVAWLLRYAPDQPTDPRPEQEQPDLGHPEAPQAAAGLDRRSTAVLALGAACLGAALSFGATAADGGAEATLARRGSRHPRWWIGAAAAGFSLATGLIDRRQASSPPRAH